MIDEQETQRRFTYHPPDDEAVIDLNATRRRFRDLASWLVGLPEGREKSLSFTALEESSFWANAAIAREDK